MNVKANLVATLLLSVSLPCAHAQTAVKSYELSEAAKQYASVDANYCMFAEPKLLDKLDLNKAKLVVDLIKIGVSDNVGQKVVSAALLAVTTDLKLQDEQFKASMDDKLWLDERSARGDGKVIVVSSENGLSAAIVNTLYGPRATNFETSGHSYIATEMAAKFKTCIPSAKQFRSRGYLFESFNTEKSKTSGVFVSSGWAVADFVVPRSAGIGGYTNHNLYNPPGGEHFFWDAYRGVMPRFISGARAVQPKNFIDGKQFVTKYPTITNFNADSPIFRDVTPADFEGYAPGGFELNQFLIEQMALTRQAIKEGKPKAEAIAELTAKVEAFKKTLPPIPEEFKIKAVAVRSGDAVPEDASLVLKMKRPEPSNSIFSSYDKSQ